MKRKIVIERIPLPFASIYEKATRMVIESYYAPLAEKIVAHLERGRILDLGTGPGYLPMEIVKRSAAIQVDGIDLSQQFVKTARANAAKSELADRLRFQAGNATNLPFEDETYEMVISTGMLHMLRDPVKALRECYRVLRRGGQAWVHDPARVASQIDVERFKKLLSPIEKIMWLLFPLYRRVNPAQKYSRNDVLAMIAATDFRQYVVEQAGGEMQIKLVK